MWNVTWGPQTGRPSLDEVGKCSWVLNNFGCMVLSSVRLSGCAVGGWEEEALLPFLWSDLLLVRGTTGWVGRESWEGFEMVLICWLGLEESQSATLFSTFLLCGVSFSSWSKSNFILGDILSTVLSLARSSGTARGMLLTSSWKIPLYRKRRVTLCSKYFPDSS